MYYQSASQLAQHILNKEVNSKELVQGFIKRREALNPKINAIVQYNDDAALASAAQLDNQLSRGELQGPLHGVPVTVKESFNMLGFKTTVNYPPLKTYLPNEESILVTRLKEAGAVIIGKTNVPTLLADSQCFGPLYPRCNNPYNLERVPGGSTGGGAAAVAAGMTSFEIGSDIGGSIRNPAHYCGLFGLKPTQNGHAEDGHVPPMPNNDTGYLDMNSTGPLARTMADIELAYKVCYQPRWDYLRYLPLDRPHAQHNSLSQYRIAWYDEIGDIRCTKDTRETLARMVKSLEDEGAKVTHIKLDRQLMIRVYQVWAKLFGFIIGQDFSWPMRQLLKLKFNQDTKGSKLHTSQALREGLGLNFKHFSAALLEQQALIAEFSKLFEDYDFILSPTSAGPAFEHNPKHKPILIDHEPTHYADYCFGFVAPYNAMRNPVLTVPGGLNAEGLPIGISIAGPHYSEAQLIHFGKLLEEKGFQFSKPDL